MQYDAFISYKSEDYHNAKKIYEFLINIGFKVFFAEEGIPWTGNADYKNTIDEAIEVSRNMIVIASDVAYFNSRWIKYEWNLFANEKLSGRKDGNLITIIDDEIDPCSLPIGLRGYQSLFFSNYKTRICHFLINDRIQITETITAAMRPRKYLPYIIIIAVLTFAITGVGVYYNKKQTDPVSINDSLMNHNKFSIIGDVKNGESSYIYQDYPSGEIDMWSVVILFVDNKGVIEGKKEGELKVKVRDNKKYQVIKFNEKEYRILDTIYEVNGVKYNAKFETAVGTGLLRI